MSSAVIVTYPDKDVIEEAEALAEAAGYRPIAVVTQDYLSRAKYGVGSGKAEELSQVVREKQAGVVLFDAKLRATQAYNLAKLCNVEVKDREKVILEIFRKRASTAEAKLQVQLAELQYELPKARDRVRMAKMGEQPGFFGLGKYDIDIYTRMMKTRIGVLRKKVEEVNKRREIFRERREKLRFPTIALAGYTAAGKTTLFNRLTGERREVDAGVFTTLAPTTRALAINHEKCLLTDTVGFISNLPTYLVESFKSTLEGVSNASVVLLVMDASQSDEKLLRSYASSSVVLSDLKVEPARLITVLNKSDLVDDDTVAQKKALLNIGDAVVVSAKTGDGIDELTGVIGARIEEELDIRSMVVGA
jgi:GTPase